MTAVNEDGAWVITDEERTRHDLLFYSQNPKDGFLTGEQARALFIRSKLPLPELSRVWKLADVTRDNQLDAAEFAVAMHVIQARLRGRAIPSSLPETLKPTPTKIASIPPMSTVERDAYKKTFDWKDKENTGFIEADTARSMFMSSCLSEEVLAKVWNLADIDRDGKLSPDEFAIALHLVRFCKKGYDLNGTINILSMIPKQAPTDSLEGRKQRLTEVLTEKRKLHSVRDKLSHELDGSKEDEAVQERIQPEYENVQFEILKLERQEEELRKIIHRMKESNKKDNFKPFDRSFLLKKRTSGQEIFSNSSGGNVTLESEDGRILTQILDSENLEELNMDDQPSKTRVHDLSENGFTNDSLKYSSESVIEHNSLEKDSQANNLLKFNSEHSFEGSNFQNGTEVIETAGAKQYRFESTKSSSEYCEDIDTEDMGANSSSQKRNKSRNKSSGEEPPLTNFKHLNTSEEQQDTSTTPKNSYTHQETNGSYSYNTHETTGSYSYTNNNDTEIMHEVRREKVEHIENQPSGLSIETCENGKAQTQEISNQEKKNDITALFVLEAMRNKPARNEKTMNEEVIIRGKLPATQKTENKSGRNTKQEEISPTHVLEIESSPGESFEYTGKKMTEYKPKLDQIVQETVYKSDVSKSPALAWEEAFTKLDLDVKKSENPKSKDETCLWVLEAMGHKPQRIEKVFNEEEVVLKKNAELPRKKEREIIKSEEVTPKHVVEIESTPVGFVSEVQVEKETKPSPRTRLADIVHEEIARIEPKREDTRMHWADSLDKLDYETQGPSTHETKQRGLDRKGSGDEVSIERKENRAVVESSVDMDDMFRKIDVETKSSPREEIVAERNMEERRDSKSHEPRRASQTDVTFELLKYEIDIDEASEEDRPSRNKEQELFSTDPKFQIPAPILKDEEEKLREAREKARLEVLRVKEEEDRIAEIRKVSFESERKRLEERLQKEREGELQRSRLSAVEAGKKLTKEIIHQKKKENEVSKPEKLDELSDVVFPAVGDNRGPVKLRKTTGLQDGNKRKSFLELELEEQRAREEEARRECELREREIKRIEEEKYRGHERVFQRQPSSEVKLERALTLEEVESAPDVKFILRKKRDDDAQKEMEEREAMAGKQRELEALKQKRLEENNFWLAEENRRREAEKRKYDEEEKVRMGREMKRKMEEEKRKRLAEEKKRLAEEARRAREEVEMKKAEEESKLRAQLEIQRTAEEEERRRMSETRFKQEEEMRKTQAQEENQRRAAAQLREVEKTLIEKRKKEEELRKKREADEMKILQIREEEKRRAEETRTMMGISKQNFLEQKNAFQRRVQEEQEARKQIPVTRRTGSFDESRTPPSRSSEPPSRGEMTVSGREEATSPREKTTPESFGDSFRSAFSRFEDKKHEEQPVVNMRSKKSSADPGSRQSWSVGDKKSLSSVEETEQPKERDELIHMETIQSVEESGPAPFWASQVKLKRAGSGMSRVSENKMKQEVDIQLQREEQLKRDNERRTHGVGVPPAFKRTESADGSSTTSYVRQGSVERDSSTFSTRSASGASSSSSSRKSSVDGASSTRGDSVDGPARIKRHNSESSSRGDEESSPLSEFDFVRLRKKMFEQPHPVNNRHSYTPGDKQASGVMAGKRTVEVMERRQVSNSESAPPGALFSEQPGVVKTRDGDKKAGNLGSVERETGDKSSHDSQVSQANPRHSITSSMTAHWNTFYANLDENEREELEREKRMEKVQMAIQQEKEEEQRKEEELKQRRSGFTQHGASFTQQSQNLAHEQTQDDRREEKIKQRESIEEQRERELEEERRLLQKRFEQQTDDKPRRRGNLAAMWEQKVAKQ